MAKILENPLLLILFFVLGVTIFGIVIDQIKSRQWRKRNSMPQGQGVNSDVPEVTVTLERIDRISVAPMLLEEIKSLIRENGIAIYAWKRKCYKCHKETTVYSYYIIHDLKKVLWSNVFDLDQCPEIGLGHIPALDKLVAEHLPAALIRQRYSRSEGESYFANGCSHCDSLQGRYYVVSDPHEIFDDFLDDDGDMGKYLVKTIYVPEPIIDEIAEYIVKDCLGF